jgi:mevalonate kinase
VVTAVDRRVRVTLEEGSGPTVLVDAPDLGIEAATGTIGGLGELSWVGADVDKRLRLSVVTAAVEAVAYALQLQGQRLPCVRLRIDSAPLALAPGGPKLGVGSSAAVAVGVCAALCARCGIGLEDEAGRRQLLELALGAHHQAQRGGSGVDVAASVLGGTLYFVRRPGAVLPERLAQLPWPAALRVIAIWSGRSVSTGSYVNLVQALRSREPAVFAERMGELTVLADEGAEAFVAGEVPAWLRAVDAYESALARLGAAAGVDIVSVQHQRISSLVRAEGGVYKPSGAGGGDLGLGFAGSDEAAAAVTKALATGGIEVVPVTLGAPGVRIEHDD